MRELGSPRVKRIVEEIVNLNLLEVADLVEILRVRLGLGPDNFGMQMQSMGAAQPATAGAAAEPAAAAPAAEKTEFNVKLDGYDAAAKIKVIKEVRAITGLGLKEAKEMVSPPPPRIPFLTHLPTHTPTQPLTRAYSYPPSLHGASFELRLRLSTSSRP